MGGGCRGGRGESYGGGVSGSRVRVKGMRTEGLMMGPGVG